MQCLKTELKTLLLQHPDTRSIYSVRERCSDLFIDGEVLELTWQHMEADNILLFIYSQLRRSGVKDTVVIDAEDTDVLVLVLYVAHQTEGMLGLKERKA